MHGRAMSGSIVTARMNSALVSDLEELATELVHRRWVTRSALISEAGEVLALCSAPLVHRVREASSGRSASEVPPGTVVARIAIEVLDEQSWIYVDLGTLRLLAPLLRPAHASTATAWLAAELRRLGVTVEREPVAHG